MRLPSPGPTVYRALDVDFEVDADPKIATFLAHALTDLEAQAGADRRRVLSVRALPGVDRWHVAWDDEPGAPAESMSKAMYEAVNQISDRAATAAFASATVLHASSFEIGGVAVVCVGASGAGKSTLAAGSALAAHRFIAEEISAIDADGQVAAFPRPIGLRAGGADVLGIQIPDGPFGFSYPFVASEVCELSGGAPLGLFAFLERNDAGPRSAAVPPGSAMARLANQALADPASGVAAFRRLENLVRATPAVAITYDGIDEALDLLRVVLETAQNAE